MNTPLDQRLRTHLIANLDETIKVVNQALRGKGMKRLASVLQRIGRGQQIPHWFNGLATDGTLPNADGKTIGSIVEMLLLAVIETHTFKGMKSPPLKINPARGVDFPDLNLGVKSPSENFCTSEPYFSAYERLLGSSHDVLVLLTDYQTAKKKSPLQLQITRWKYLRSTQVADQNLCKIARKHRSWLLAQDEGRAQRFFRFLAYINQSDWRAARLLSMVADMQDDGLLRQHISHARKEFAKTNQSRLKSGRVPIPESELEAIEKIDLGGPLHITLMDAVDNWLAEVLKETARAPSPHEWQQIIVSPLEGMIGVSLALQWRYNFGRLFSAEPHEFENTCGE